ncbi:MAG TPA: TIGR01212 family radical SAM protein [Planctomycetota bacterium]|nr:TIGR01212 family radical SAM protein [Planctomycetota bacterium]
MLPEHPPLHTLGRHLKAHYGRRLRRIMFDIGTSCPNRDGQTGFGGCIYCDIDGSGTGARRKEKSLAEQWEEGLRRVRRSQPNGPAAIAYVQSYSNTYPDLLPLAKALEFLANRADIAPIVSVGTRPDCFGEEAAALLASYCDKFSEVWVEFGLETADDEIQKTIGRHDTLANYHAACHLAHKQGLKIITHTIAGLPGEKMTGLELQVQEAIQSGSHGIKFHQLMVLRKTKLEALWRKGGLDLLQLEEYVEMVANALTLLPSEMVIHRLVAENPPESYLAPEDWPTRAKVQDLIEKKYRALVAPGT